MQLIDLSRYFASKDQPIRRGQNAGLVAPSINADPKAATPEQSESLIRITSKTIKRGSVSRVAFMFERILENLKKEVVTKRDKNEATKNGNPQYSVTYSEYNVANLTARTVLMLIGVSSGPLTELQKENHSSSVVTVSRPKTELPTQALSHVTRQRLSKAFFFPST